MDLGSWSWLEKGITNMRREEMNEPVVLNQNWDCHCEPIIFTDG